MKRRTEQTEEDIIISTASNDLEEARIFPHGDRHTTSTQIPNIATMTNFNGAK